MMIAVWPLGLLIAGSPIAVHAEDARDVTHVEVARMLSDLGRAIERRTGAQTNIRPFEGGDNCSRKESCRRFIYEATGAERVVYVRFIGVPTRVRIIAELVGVEKGVIRRAQVDVARMASNTSMRLDTLAVSLFPEGVVEDPKPAPKPPQPRMSTEAAVSLTPPIESIAMSPSPEPEPQSEHRTWPWWILGGSVAAGGLAVGLGVENAHIRDEGSKPGVPSARVSDLQDQTFRTALGANVLFGLAAVGLVTGTVLLLMD
jgi:hypothetical protein